MINLAYIVFVWILVAEVILFLLLTLPTPVAFKARLIRAFMWSQVRNTLKWVHLAMCVLAGIFFFELVQTQINYFAQIEQLRNSSSGQVGNELRIGFLSYQIQKVQRNKQITVMLIYASIAINLFIRMQHLVFKQCGDYQELPPVRKPTQSPISTPSQQVNFPVKTPVKLTQLKQVKEPEPVKFA